MAATEWHAADHPRDDSGRFISGGAIWYVDQQFAAHARQHESEQRAIEVAASALEKSDTQQTEWRAASNEWRKAMDDRERKFVGAAEFATLSGAVDKLQDENARREERERSRADNEARERGAAERRSADQIRNVGILVTFISIVFSAVLGVLMRNL